MTQRKQCAAFPYFLNWWFSLFSNSFCNTFYGCHLHKSCGANVDRVITKLFWPSGTLVLAVSRCLLSMFNLHYLCSPWEELFSMQYCDFLFHLQRFFILFYAVRLYRKWLIPQHCLSQIFFSCIIEHHPPAAL